MILDILLSVCLYYVGIEVRTHWIPIHARSSYFGTTIRAKFYLIGFVIPRLATLCSTHSYFVQLPNYTLQESISLIKFLTYYFVL